MAGRTRSIKCPYEQKKECSSGCIHTKTCARWKEITKVGLCKGCDLHAAGCHATCKAYGLWRAEHEKERKTICENRKKDMEVWSYARYASEKMRKRRKNRRKE